MTRTSNFTQSMYSTFEPEIPIYRSVCRETIPLQPDPKNFNIVSEWEKKSGIYLEGSLKKKNFKVKIKTMSWNYYTRRVQS